MRFIPCHNQSLSVSILSTRLFDASCRLHSMRQWYATLCFRILSKSLQCFHEVQQVREILSCVLNAMDSGRSSRKTTETARINLYHLLNHPCKPEHIESLQLKKFVQRLTHYPNPHVVQLATELLEHAEWKA